MRPKGESSIERLDSTPHPDHPRARLILLTFHKAHLSVCTPFLVTSARIIVHVFFRVEQTRQRFDRFSTILGLVLQSVAMRCRGRQAFVYAGTIDYRMKIENTILRLLQTGRTAVSDRQVW